MIKSTAILALQFCFALIVSLFFFELYLKSDQKKYHSYGWVANNTVEQNIRSCQELNRRSVVGVFGDSFVEYYLGSQANLANQIQSHISSLSSVCNFGLSGTDLPTYLKRFEIVLKQGFILDSAIVFIH